jgi:hypothetical protein
MSSPASSFERLPVELHRIILGHLPDFSSLRSTVVASRSAHDAYLHSPLSIQKDVFRRVLFNEPHLAVESRWLHAASYIRRNTPDWHDEMDNFLAYAGSEAERQRTKNPLETVTPEGLRFHIVVEDISSAILEDVLPSTPDDATSLSEGTSLNMPWRLAEGISTQRALYRFQRVCQMYPRNTKNSHHGVQKAGHPLRGFIRALPRSELEELHWVYRYLISRLSFLDGPEYSAVHAQAGNGNTSSYRYKEQVVSMGLIFLRNLVVAPAESRLALLKQYCQPEIRPLSEMLPLDPNNRSTSLRGKPRSSRHICVHAQRGAGVCLFSFGHRFQRSTCTIYETRRMYHRQRHLLEATGGHAI